MIKEVIDILWSETKIESEVAGPFLQTMPLKLYEVFQLSSVASPTI